MSIARSKTRSDHRRGSMELAESRGGSLKMGRMKIGVIGAGAVGSACLLSSILRGTAREIVVVNRDRKRAKAVVTDLQYGAALTVAFFERSQQLVRGGGDVTDASTGRVMDRVYDRGAGPADAKLANALAA
jgi:shikimate 5-dehydrogenase